MWKDILDFDNKRRERNKNQRLNEEEMNEVDEELFEENSTINEVALPSKNMHNGKDEFITKKMKTPAKELNSMWSADCFHNP